MSAFRHEQGKSVVVAEVRTAAQAEVIKMTLAAHGFQAVVSPSFPAYPSVDFVEGRRVSVLAADEHAVRDVLRRLGMGSPNPGEQAD